MKPAVFLDRDGTMIREVHHLTDPNEVELLPGCAESIRELRAAGYLCIVVTNQSVIGRGMLDEAGLAEVHAELDRQLETAGTAIDGLYFCPRAPTQKDRTVVEHPDRKPGPGMLQRAAREHDLDLASSWMVGDSVSDTLCGRNAGCRGSILVRTGHGKDFVSFEDCYDYLADDIGEATRIMLQKDTQ